VLVRRVYEAEDGHEGGDHVVDVHLVRLRGQAGFGERLGAKLGGLLDGERREVSLSSGQ